MEERGYLPDSNCESLLVAALTTFFAVSMIMVYVICKLFQMERYEVLGRNKKENSQPAYTILYERNLYRYITFKAPISVRV